MRGNNLTVLKIFDEWQSFILKRNRKGSLFDGVGFVRLACCPSSGRAWGPATLSVGEGDLPAGALYPLLGEGGRAEGPDGCGAGPRTDLVPPLFRRRHPLPSVLSEGAAAGLGVEGTPTGPGRTGIKSPPPEEAFPHGEGGPGAARAG